MRGATFWHVHTAVESKSKLQAKFIIVIIFIIFVHFGNPNTIDLFYTTYRSSSLFETIGNKRAQMKCYSLALSSALLVVAAWIPGSESFCPASQSLKHKINSNIYSSSDNNSKNPNIDCIDLQNSMKKTNNEEMVAAQEAEAKKICPLIPPPEDVTATFEAAMG